MSDDKRSSGEKLLLWGVVLAYVLIGVEIIIMISPFALYFYSVYAPILNTLAASPLTSWTTEFFLPHMVFPDDPLINAISYLQVLMVAGLFLFLFAAVPLYYGRFTGKGVVQFSIYSRIRHPQYLFLAISGLGLLLYWPRFIILIMYVTMLFVYYLLARNEEWRMLREAPESYPEYMAKTPMFLPGEPGGRIYRALFGWITPKWLGIFVLYILVLAVTTGLAMGLRAYTIRHLPVVNVDEGMTVLPVFPRDSETVKEVYRAATSDPLVRQGLGSPPAANLAYLMPGDFFLMALVTDEHRRFSENMIERFPEILEWHQHRFKGGLGKFFRIFYNFVRTLGTVESDYDIERLIFMQVLEQDGRMVEPERLFALGLKRRPLMLVDVDADTHQVLSVVRTTESHKWGDVPMPTF